MLRTQCRTEKNTHNTANQAYSGDLQETELNRWIPIPLKSEKFEKNVVDDENRKLKNERGCWERPRR